MIRIERLKILNNCSGTSVTLPERTWAELFQALEILTSYCTKYRLEQRKEKSLELDHLSIMKGGLRHASVAETSSFRILQIFAQDFSGDKLSEVLH